MLLLNVMILTFSTASIINDITSTLITVSNADTLSCVVISFFFMSGIYPVDLFEVKAEVKPVAFMFLV